MFTEHMTMNAHDYPVKNSYKNIYLHAAPINRLPSCILRYIMILGDEEPGDPYEIARGMGSTMACTSHYFRSIAVITPSLWTHISNAFSWEEINRRIVRSGREPLKLDFWLSDTSFGKIHSMWSTLAFLRDSRGSDIAEIRFKTPLDGSFCGRTRREWCARMHNFCSDFYFDSLRKVAIYDRYGSRLEGKQTHNSVRDMKSASARLILNQRISDGGDIVHSMESMTLASTEYSNFPLLWKAGGLREMTYHYALPEPYVFETRHKHIRIFTCVLRGQNSELRRLGEILSCMQVLECLNVTLGIGHEWDLLAFQEYDRPWQLRHKSVKVRMLKQLSLEATAEQGIVFLLALDAPVLKKCKTTCILPYASLEKARAMIKSMGYINTCFVLRMSQARGSAGLYEYLDLPSRLMSEPLEDLQRTEDELKSDLNPSNVSPRFGNHVIAGFAAARREEDLDPTVSIRLSTLIISPPIRRDVVVRCASGSADNNLLRHMLECNLCTKCK